MTKKKKAKIFYIYVDRTADDNTPFYIGKGQWARVLDVKKRNAVWFRIVSRYGYTREVLFGTTDESFAFEEEIKLIEKYKTYRPKGKHNTHWGANLTIGGEGASGIIQTEETRLKRVKASTGSNNGMYGKKHKPETLEKISGENHYNYGKTLPPNVLANFIFSQGEYPCCILTLQQVAEIRDKWKVGGINQTELAEEYGVKRTTINSIVRNRSWISEDYIPLSDSRFKLTPTQVEQIKIDYITVKSTRKLAVKYNVGSASIARIVRNGSNKNNP